MRWVKKSEEKGGGRVALRSGSRGYYMVFVDTYQIGAIVLVSEIMLTRYFFVTQLIDCFIVASKELRVEGGSQIGESLKKGRWS